MEDKKEKLEFTPYRANEVLENYFYMVPIELFNSSLYKGKLNSDSILLYSFLLSLFRLSVEHNWIDSNGLIYVIFPRSKAMEMLNASDKTISKAFKLLKDANLIDERKFGKNKPNHIYIGKIQHIPEENFRTRKNYDSGTGKSTTQDTENLRGNNIYNNKYLNNNSKPQKKTFANYQQKSYTEDFLKGFYCNMNFEKGSNENEE